MQISVGPRLSILVPTRDRKDGLKKVIDAVLKDRNEYPNMEIVVIDGCSKDGTVEMLRSLGDRIVWKSQESRGLYAALNEALALSTGEWVRMMADDDDYLPGSVHQIVSCMREHPDALGVGGISSFESWNPADAVRRGNAGRVTGELTMRSCVDFQQPFLYSHEAMYFRRQPLLSVGGWDTRFAVCGDLDVQFRLLATGGSFFVVPFEVLHAKRHRGSATVRLAKRAFFELFYILVRSRQWWFLRKKAVERSRRLIKLVWR